jgi:hypothetical protein
VAGSFVSLYGAGSRWQIGFDSADGGAKERDAWGKSLTLTSSHQLRFGTTYLCEETSAMTAITSKYRNRLQIESSLRIPAPTIHPMMSHIVCNMLAHPFH